MTKPNSHFFLSPRSFPGIPTLLLSLLFISGPSILASDYYPPRVSHVEGNAAYIPAGKVDWEEITVNVPILTGDRVYSQSNSRLEVELGDANFLRLADETDLTFDDALEKEIRLNLEVGVMIIRINKPRRIWVRTPYATVEVKRKGLYRLGVDTSGQMQVIVRKGRAFVETAGGKQRLDDGEEIVLGSRYQGPMQVSQYSFQDEFDRWSDRRDARYMKSQSVSYVGGSYYPGVYELDRYGYWTSYPGCGRVWIPHVSVGWAPFRTGFWFHFGLGFGWTWISHEPWGWLPYHYGRWHYYHPHRRWCWIPGPFRRWYPHRVHFYHGGGYVGWAPTPHGFVNNNNVTVINNNTIINRPPREGLTVVRQEDFGRRARPAAASRELADSFRPGLPKDVSLSRKVADNRGTATASRRDVLNRSRTPSTSPTSSAARGTSRTEVPRSAAAGNTFSPTRNEPRTSRVLRAGSAQRTVTPDSSGVVTLPPRTNNRSSVGRSYTLSERQTKAAHRSSASGLSRNGITSSSRSRAVTTSPPKPGSSGLDMTHRSVKRISRATALDARSRSTVKPNGERVLTAPAAKSSTLGKNIRSLSPNVSRAVTPNTTRSTGSRKNVKRFSTPSQSYYRPRTGSPRATVVRPRQRSGSSSLNRGYSRPSRPSYSRPAAPSSGRSYGTRAPSRSFPSRSYSRPSSPSRSAPSSPSRARPSGRGNRNR